jgi:hypothetical protein
MGIRINMENKIDEINRRLLLIEGAVEDLLEIYKENKNVKKKASKGKKESSKKAFLSKKEK